MVLRWTMYWVALGGMLCASSALACSCEHPHINPDPLDAPHIFLGQVTRVEDYATGPRTGRVNLRKVCLRAEHVIWGPPANEGSDFCVVTGVGGGDCGIQFKPGEDYMVYAGPSPGDAPDAGLPYTGLCWATSKAQRVKPIPGNKPLLPSAGAFVAGFGMGAAVLFLLHRSRRAAHGDG